MSGRQTRADRPEGLRERKRRLTRQRIAEVALRLFLEKGYDETTLNEIAFAADISRRTVFHYFDSKDAILLAWQSGAEGIFHTALADASPDSAPIDVVRDALLTMVSRYETGEAIAIDRLLRSTEALRARKQADYKRQEEALFAALVQKWPAPENRVRLRVVAMMGIGAMRIAAEAWSAEQGARSLDAHLQEAFAALTDRAPQE
ncbi:TetR/AcrR family transcriptional regulator [Ancylobacter mangrovi]|uniref:TetR/AcrR family transcriptional regulator n=1 Tax=Ancylobacter mangrovi TaxID=2972472 RepID=UPI0021626593|nr:TetR/AcrR family transcriptional regulator [Ancylobacter mangrovi]MCS0500899.1 TetR/AcrR family transcriptional regulator [Ancylobacter mangrovi]